MGDLTKIAEAEGWNIPEWMFEKQSQIVARTPESLRYTCAECGLQEPRKCRNGYARRQCPCERSAMSQAIVKQGKASTVVSQTKAVANRTYCWLGSDGYEEPGLEGKTFNNFSPDAQPKRALFAQALNFARAYAGQVINHEQPGNVLLSGGYGTGKTHLCAAICNTLRSVGVGCLFCTAQNLFNALYSVSFAEKSEIIRQASSTPLLVLDDLDKLHIGSRSNPEDAGKYQQNTLFEILNNRYRRGLPTIITTNARADLSTWLNGATISRLWERITPLEMVGIDYRTKGA